MPPTGRMKYPTPNVAIVSSNDAYSLSAGKNSREMMTVRKPKTMKSYHSSAFPITTAAIWNGFDAVFFIADTAPRQAVCLVISGRAAIIRPAARVIRAERTNATATAINPAR